MRHSVVLAWALILISPLLMAQPFGSRGVVPSDARFLAMEPYIAGFPGTRLDGDESQAYLSEAFAAEEPKGAGFAVTGRTREQAAAISDSATRFRTTALMIAGIGGTLAYGQAKWWQDGFSGGFKTVDEGWFGQGTEYGGADKLGHAMFAYTGTRLLARAFEWAGNDSETALRLGLWTAVGTLMGVELIDGFSRKWRFSKEDALANLAGGTLAYAMERNSALDALIDVRIQYSWLSGNNFDPFGDYSRQRYLVVLKGSGVPTLKQHPLLKYLEINLGYGTRDFDPDSALTTGTRHVYYGISLNLTELLRTTVYKANSSPTHAQSVTENLFEFMQVPATTIQSDHLIR